MTSDEVIAQARAYLDDRRLPLPRPHELAVALVELADQLEDDHVSKIPTV